MQEIHFQHSAPFTIGVELEFQLLDPTTLNLTPAAPALLAELPSSYQQRIKPEFIQSMIEINTDICNTIQEVEVKLKDLCEFVDHLAMENNCVPYAASLHPFASSTDQSITEDQRYNDILRKLQIAGRQFIAQGLHVHVGVNDKEKVIRICDNIRTILPVFLALSASSPYFESYDTGFHSYRAMLFEALPRSGIPDYFGSWNKYQTLVSILLQYDAIKQIRDLWWDVRPHPDLGTIEIRICDLPSRFNEIIALVALVQAVVVKIAHAPTGNTIPHMQIIKHNRWSAARYGLKGDYIATPDLGLISLADAAANLVHEVSQYADTLGSIAYLEPLESIIKEGTSADLQRKIYNDSHSFHEVINNTHEEFWK